MGVTAQAVYNHILDFFVAASGRDCDNDGNAKVLEESDQQCLLRTACMGNPERTMQGELFVYLKKLNGIRPVLEFRHHRLDGVDAGKGRGNSIDIMVFDASYRPVVAVELKHHSRQQGTLNRLAATLDADRDRLCKLTVPSVQVGLYTELLDLGKHADSRDKYQDFRFITAYAYAEDNAGHHQPKMRTAAKPLDASVLRKWASKNFKPFDSSFSGRAETFSTRDGAVVRGRVHYIVGLGQPGPRPLECSFRAPGRTA